MAENGMRFVAETRSFIREFESNLSKKTTNQHAYEATEREHERITGRRKYKDYSVFKAAKSRKRR